MDNPQGVLHAIQHGLHVGESIHALATVHPGNPVAAGSRASITHHELLCCPSHLQKIPLQAERHWRFGIHDGVAGSRDVHPEDGLSADLLGCGPRAQGGDQPGPREFQLTQRNQRDAPGSPKKRPPQDLVVGGEEEEAHTILSPPRDSQRSGLVEERT